MKYLTVFSVALALLAVADPAAAKTVRIKACGSVITTPGSYVVTRNLVGGAGGGAGGCITVSASNVTLDLGGYNIDCQSNGLHGIAVDDGENGITIRNGTIANCSEGIAAAGATGLWIDGVLTLSNQSHGIRVGAKSTVVRCLSYDNVGYGIMAQCPSNVTADVAVGNYNPFYLNGAGCNAQLITP